MNKDVQEKVNNLSMLEQNAQQMAAQRQNFQTQLLEVESAIEEISNSKETYKIIGNIMIKTEPANALLYHYRGIAKTRSSDLGGEEELDAIVGGIKKIKENLGELLDESADITTKSRWK